MANEPRVYDRLEVYGERMTILSVTEDRVAVQDDAGLRIERLRDRLVWDDAAQCWRVIGDTPDPSWRATSDGYVVAPLEWKGEPDDLNREGDPAFNGAFDKW